MCLLVHNQFAIYDIHYDMCKYGIQRLKIIFGCKLILPFRCGNVAAILELDEHLNKDFTIFEAAPQVNRPIFFGVLVLFFGKGLYSYVALFYIFSNVCIYDIYMFFSYKKHVYEKYEADIKHMVRNI